MTRQPSEVQKSTDISRLRPLQACLTGTERLIAYNEIAAQLNTTESAVKMAVHRLRKRYGELLREEIAQTVATPAEVAEEIRCLIAATGA